MSSESSILRPAAGAGRRSERPGRRARAAHRWLLIALHLILLAVFLRILASGLDYYLTPLQERPRHQLYWMLKPGGERGHLLGIAGSVMMSVMLLYSARRRWSRLRRAGPLRVWLDYHILLGIWGPLFVVLHSSFKVQGLVSVSFWSMVAVAASGVFGRFLYVQIPRSMAGDELSLTQVKELDAALSFALSTDFGLDREAIAQVETIAESGLDPRRPLVVLLARMVVDPWRVRLRLRRLRQGLGAVERRAGRPLRAVVLRKAILHRRLLLWDRLRELFHYWHVLHKPFALLMYLFMVVHIGVAWMTGYAWGGG